MGPRWKARAYSKSRSQIGTLPEFSRTSLTKPTIPHPQWMRLVPVWCWLIDNGDDVAIDIDIDTVLMLILILMMMMMMMVMIQIHDE